MFQIAVGLELVTLAVMADVSTTLHPSDWETRVLGFLDSAVAGP